MHIRYYVSPPRTNKSTTFKFNSSFSLALPENFAELAGAANENDIEISDANAINKQYLGGNITSDDTVQMLDYLVQSVYRAIPDHASSPYACEINGLAKLECSSTRSSVYKSGAPIRAVGLAGLFMSAPWATGGKDLSLKERQKFYTATDFEDMKKLGLNTVQISIPASLFHDKDDSEGSDMKPLLQEVLGYVEDVGLKAILALVTTGDDMEALVSAAEFSVAHKDAVLGLVLPSKASTLLSTASMINAIRVPAPKLNIFVHANAGDIATLAAQDDHVFGALELTHTSSIADIASSSSQEDRSKLFYHEATSCMARSPLEFLSCFRDIPSYVTSGFDLAIDNCAFSYEDKFQDFGQCDRFNETQYSDWWKRHRESYAARQLFAYERGMGWSFATWKLYNEHEYGEIDKPEKLLSLKDVVAAGLFPNLENGDETNLACLNPPASDFVLGDATLAPTMGPPPDCGNGWWNYTTEQCDYWIPPPEPTPAPTEPCPVCDACSTSSSIIGTGVIGVAIGAAVSYLVFKNKRNNYQAIPN